MTLHRCEMVKSSSRWPLWVSTAPTHFSATAAPASASAYSGLKSSGAILTLPLLPMMN